MEEQKHLAKQLVILLRLFGKRLKKWDVALLEII